jgi:hypothetical protein
MDFLNLIGAARLPISGVHAFGCSGRVGLFP